MRKRMKPEDRKESILNAAVTLARTIGYTHLTLQAVAGASDITHALVLSYFGSVNALRTAVLNRAIQDKDHVIIMQGIVISDPIVLMIPDSLRNESIDAIR